MSAPHPQADSRAHLLVLSAKTETALDGATQRLREFLLDDDSVNLSDVAFTLQIGRKAYPRRRCLVCDGRQDAINVLGEEGSKRVLSGRVDAAEAGRRPLILLLPGIGDHYVGMAHDLYESWPVFRQEVDRCSQILEAHLGSDIRSVIYPEGQGWKQRDKPKGIDLKQMLGRKTDAPEDADSRKLNQTLFAQPALFAIEYAMARLWQSLGLRPDAIVGHSMGEYVAACLAGVMSLEDALRLIAARARLVSELPQGAMLAVTLPEAELLPWLPEELSISLINAPRLCVVAGPVAAVAEFEQKLNEKGIICRHVQNAHAFHSRMLDPIVKPFEAEVRKVQLNEPAIPYISNVTGTWITRGEAISPAYWASHANHTARFSDALHKVWEFKNPILLEAGPGRTLGVLTMQHPDRPARHSLDEGGRDGGDPVAVSSIRHNYENQSDIEFLWQAIGRLWLSGVEIRWENVHRAGRRRRVPLPTYPFDRQHYWLEPRVPKTEDADKGRGRGQMVHKNPDSSQWLYVPSWKRLLPRAIGIHEAATQLERPRTWLVFADECGFASVLMARLEAAGDVVITVRAGNGFQQADSRNFTIEPASFQHYDSMIRALQVDQSLPDGIVHAWSITPVPSLQPEGDGFTQAQALGFYSLLFLARALAAHNVGDEIKLFALSNNVQEVCGAEILSPEKATVIGPCMVIRQEHPNIRVKSIDLDVSGQASEHEAAADLVMGEFLGSDSSVFVAHRNSQRWVQTYEPVRPSPFLPLPIRWGEGRGEGTLRSQFRQGGVYLITGGLGNIGIAISEYLARSYRAKLVLVGRSRLPGRETWDAWIGSHAADDPVCAKIRAIERIEKPGGEVLYVNASVADVNEMRRVIEQTYERFGNLHGVIHGAGIVGDDGYREIKDSDFATCDGHFQAKAHGVRVLEEVLDGKPLDFCLLLSSLASVLGGIGQAAYASANLYMDLFARRHNRKCRSLHRMGGGSKGEGVPWLSVNWDVWRQEDRAAFDSGLGTTLKELGMSAEEAMEMMETALALRSAGQLVVSTGDLRARIDQWIHLESLNSQDERPGTRGEKTRATGHASPVTRDPPRDETEQQIAQIWQQSLGIEAVGIHDNFSQLGGHSLLAIRIVSELRRAFQIDLPVRALFDAPTVAELSKYIKDQLIAEIDALTEEQAQQLVSRE